jgi:hypothetical protein
LSAIPFAVFEVQPSTSLLTRYAAILHLTILVIPFVWVRLVSPSQDCLFVSVGQRLNHSAFSKTLTMLDILKKQNDLIFDLRTQIDNLEMVRLNEPKRTESQELSNVKSQHNELRERLKAELQKQQKELRTMRRVVDREMAKCTRQEDLTKMRQQITYAERKILSIDISVSGLESRVRSKLMESVDDRLSTFQSNLTETLLAQPLDSCTIETKVGQN